MVDENHEEEVIDNIISGDKQMTKYLIVKKYIDEMDYFSLLSGGAPDDEFDSESQEISYKITDAHTVQDIAGVIADVFNRTFNNNVEESCFAECAGKIYADLHC